ncbi:Phthiocerol synthesis polyketide synthase type I PpsC [Shimia sp. SK013]|uniref:NADPH:quinone reductase n=1 Tax=Shimia sp. SK013 TaxID=1389006 RepID=UPI0006B4CEA9|nr:NADPH:quinone reductase [Shimia sp. SK013]KPA20163.1 Phthiocerol synthesis polyketide synthase type I PpsC [Shimia sp. SK013]
MKAVTWRAFGPARDVVSVEDIATPEAGPGEVLVRVAFSGVNPSDCKARSGSRPGVTKPAFEVIVPHSDGAGVIEAVGAGVDANRVGQRVWLWNGQWQRAFGTCAEYIAVPAEMAVALPAGVSLEDGAVLGIPGLTAAQTVFGGGDVSGQTVLVSGGGGSVGYLAVQLAAWAGARVIATCGARDMERVRAAGADVVLDYRSETLVADIMAGSDGAGVDRAVEVEFGPNLPILCEVMKPLGTIAAYGSAKDMAPQMPFGPMLFKALKLDITLIYILPLEARLAAVAKLHEALTAGALRFEPPHIFAIEKAANAHEMVETGGRTGAVLVRC